MKGQTAVEEWVIEASKQLGLPIETSGDDFFEAGATSLTIMRLIARVEEEFGPDSLTPEEVVEHSGVQEIAAAIIENTQGSALAAADE